MRKSSANHNSVNNGNCILRDESKAKSKVELNDQLLFEKIQLTIQFFDKIFRQIATCQSEDVLRSLELARPPDPNSQKNQGGGYKAKYRKFALVDRYQEVDPSPPSEDEKTMKDSAELVVREEVNNNLPQLAGQTSIQEEVLHKPTGKIPPIEVPQSSLTDTQCEAIFQLSGYLQTLYDIVYNHRIAKLHQRSIFDDLPLHIPSRCTADGLGVRNSTVPIDNLIENVADTTSVTAPIISSTATTSSSIGSPLGDQVTATTPNTNNGECGKSGNTPIPSFNDKDEHIDFLSRKVSLLQELLVDELNRSEQLHCTLNETELQLLSVTEERNALQKKINKTIGRSSQIAPVNASSSVHRNVNNASTESTVKHDASTPRSSVAQVKSSSSALSSSSSNVVTSNNTPDLNDPDSLIGRYVHKTFNNHKYFGIICSYNKPYFMVVYDDGDNEEISKSEMREILWNGPVPTNRVAQCERHKKRLEALKFQRNHHELMETQVPPVAMSAVAHMLSHIQKNSGSKRKGGTTNNGANTKAPSANHNTANKNNNSKSSKISNSNNNQKVDKNKKKRPRKSESDNSSSSDVSLSDNESSHSSRHGENDYWSRSSDDEKNENTSVVEKSAKKSPRSNVVVPSSSSGGKVEQNSKTQPPTALNLVISSNESLQLDRSTSNTSSDAFDNKRSVPINLSSSLASTTINGTNVDVKAEIGNKTRSRPRGSDIGTSPDVTQTDQKHTVVVGTMSDQLSSVTTKKFTLDMEKNLSTISNTNSSNGTSIKIGMSPQATRVQGNMKTHQPLPLIDPKTFFQQFHTGSNGVDGYFVETPFHLKGKTDFSPKKPIQQHTIIDLDAIDGNNDVIPLGKSATNTVSNNSNETGIGEPTDKDDGSDSDAIVITVNEVSNQKKRIPVTIPNENADSTSNGTLSIDEAKKHPLSSSQDTEPQLLQVQKLEAESKKPRIVIDLSI